MGVLDYLSNLITITHRSKSKKKPMQTVELKVKMDCEGCERKVKQAVSKIKGATSWDVNRKESRVTVTGYVEPKKVLKKVRRTGKIAEIWPYVPYNLVAYPYVAQAYDRKAAPGFVKKVPEAVRIPNGMDDNLGSLFSDDNPHACSIM